MNSLRAFLYNNPSILLFFHIRGTLQDMYQPMRVMRA